MSATMSVKYITMKIVEVGGIEGDKGYREFLEADQGRQGRRSLCKIVT